MTWVLGGGACWEAWQLLFCVCSRLRSRSHCPLRIQLVFFGLVHKLGSRRGAAVQAFPPSRAFFGRCRHQARLHFAARRVVQPNAELNKPRLSRLAAWALAHVRDSANYLRLTSTVQREPAKSVFNNTENPFKQLVSSYFQDCRTPPFALDRGELLLPQFPPIPEKKLVSSMSSWI